MVSFQFSYPLRIIIVAGILLPDLFPKHFCFFLGVSGCSALGLPFLDMVYTLEASVEKSLLMVHYCTFSVKWQELCYFQSGRDRGISKLPQPFLACGCIFFGCLTEFADI